VAVYTVARHGPRRHLWPVIAVIALPAAVVLLWNGPNWTALGFVTAVLAATVLLGVTVSTREAYLAALEERARRLERDRDQQAQLAVAAERARIARDMHDIVAHNLAVIVALADGAALTATAAPERAADTMNKVSATGRQALGEMRRLLGVLRDDDAGRAPQPGLANLDALVEQVRAAGMRVALTTEGVPGTCGPGAGLAIYRIVQEALTNTLKHAGPQANAHVRLRYRDDGADPGGQRRRCSPAVGTDSGRWARPGRDDRTGRGVRWPPRSRTVRRRRLARTRPPALRRRRRYMTTRVLLVDDQPMPRLGFRMVLETQPDLEVVGEAGDGVQAVSMTRALLPDVVLMDARMPVMDGIEATRQIVESGSAARILVLTTFKPGRVRVRRAARRSERVPAQGRATGRPAHRHPRSRRG
jgi:CheY-like chemotaxis protein